MRELQFQVTGLSEDDTRRWRRPSRRPTPARAVGWGVLGIAVLYLLAGAKSSGRVEITSPASGATTLDAQILVSGRASDIQADAFDLDVNGSLQTVPASQGSFDALVQLAVGVNTILASADGISSEPITIVRRAQPVVRISSPSEKSVTTQAAVEVTGALENSEERAVTLNVNGNAQPVTVTNARFSATVPLVVGRNVIQALVAGASPAMVEVSRLETGIAITSPSSGFTTDLATVIVTGTVENVDAGTITLKSDELSRTVQAQNGSFTSEVGLHLGDNRIQASVGDALSNEIVVHRSAPPVIIALTSPQSGPTQSAVASVRGTVQNARNNTITLTVNGSSRAVPMTGGGFTAEVRLEVGDNRIQASQGDAVSNEVVVNRQPLPTLIKIISPQSGPNRNSSVRVTGTITNPQGSTITLTINDSSRALNIINGGFASDVALGIGDNRIQASQGGAVSNEVVVNRPPLPTLIKIISPQSGSTKDSVVTVTGRVVNPRGDPITLTVNRSLISVQTTPTSFTARVQLVPGDNLIEASIPGASDQIRLVRMVRPEVRIVIISPRDGTTTKQPSILVTGRAENADVGTITLTVNRNPMQVPLRLGEFRSEVKLSPGKNFIQASSGSAVSQVVTVTVEARVENPSIQIISPRSGPAREAVVIVTGRVVNPRGDPITVTVNRSPIRVQTTPGGFTARAQLVPGDNLIEASIPGASDQIRLVRMVRPEVRIVIVSPRDGTTTKRPSIPVAGRVENSDAGTITLTVNRNSFPVRVQQGEFQSEVKLSPGKNFIQASLGSALSQVVTVTVETRVENPSIQIISPRSGPAREAVVIVTGRVVNPRGDPITVTVNRSPIRVQTTPGGFTAQVQLIPGDNLIEASIPGASDQIRLVRLVRPEVRIVITSPRDGTITKRPSIPVAGRVENSDAGTITLTVNRNSFPVRVQQGEFQSEIKLSPGKNSIQASLGSVRSQGVTVTLQTSGDNPDGTPDECSKINCDCKNVRGPRIGADAWSRAFGSSVTEQPPIFTARVSTPPQDRQAQCRAAEETLKRRCRATGKVSGACPPDASGPNAWPSSDKKRSFSIPKKQGAKP